MRAILYILAVASIVLGVLAIVGSCFAYQSQFLEHLSLDKAILIFGIAFGVFIITAASFGVYGIAHQKRSCILLFWITLGLFFLVSMIFTIVLIFARRQYRSQFSEPNCAVPSTELRSLERAYLHANMLCTAHCPCDYKGLPPYDPKFVIYKDGAIRAPQCPHFDDSLYRFEAILLHGVQISHKCAGICNTGTLPGFPNYYRFSDVNYNNGKVSRGTCEKYVWPYLNQKLLIIIQITLGIVVVSCISFIMITVLCIYGRQHKSPYWAGSYQEEDSPLLN